MQMAERRLLPAVRAAEADTLIVAGGIAATDRPGSGRRAWHPAEVLAEA
jgi:hypothetical protein